MMTNLGLDSVAPKIDRVPIILLIDTSDSMKKEIVDSQGETKTKIDQVCQFMRNNLQDLNTPDHKIVELANITFSGRIKIEQEFVPIDQWSPPTSSALTKNSVGAGIMRAIELGENIIDKNTTTRYDPMQLFLFSDGVNINTELDDKVRDTLSKGFSEGYISSLVCIGVTKSKLTELEKLTKFKSKGWGETHTINIEDFKFEEYLFYDTRSSLDMCPNCGVNLSKYSYMKMDFCPECGSEQ